MLNPKPIIVTAEHEVRQELRALGMTQEFVIAVAKAVSAGKADALAVDPLSTPGTFGYIKGVRTIRLSLLPLGWRISRVGNVESTVSDVLGIQLCFQNVDMACTDRNPQAISGKGSGSRGLINAGQQGELFARAEDKTKQIRGVVPLVWVICVSTEGKKLRAEVSCPQVFEGDQFSGFSKRIFVVDEDLNPTPDTDIKPDDDSGTDQYEVRIAKK